MKRIKNALISVYHKDGLDEILKMLAADGVNFISTGGTADFIRQAGYECKAVEDLTGYPSIFGGRVKTLHPKVFGGILHRRSLEEDVKVAAKMQIPEIDLVIVDLYPFEATVAAGLPEADIIEKIDIGGISLIRAAAKNFVDVVIVASKKQYSTLAKILKEHGAQTTIEERKALAREAFAVSSAYDSAIFNWFDSTTEDDDAHTSLRYAVDGSMSLRYGENPHQPARFYGDFDSMFEQLHGKQVSYNNILDIDSAVALIDDLGDEPSVAVIKHNNACGVATRPTLLDAWVDALAGDPVSAFGGVIVANKEIDAIVAEEISKLFFEILIAPGFTKDALEILQVKKNRILLKRLDGKISATTMRTALNGVLVQQRDTFIETPELLEVVTNLAPTPEQIDDLLFANKIVKHSKSNAIVLAKNGQLLASGVGQTSRVDALKQAIEKAGTFGFDLNGAVMASDAFFPFADCVEIADKAGIKAVIHPGGSIRDAESIDYCNAHNMAMVKTGIRHFRH